MKLKTTINGKQSTVIGTPAEVAEFLDVARKKAIRRAVGALPRPVKLGEGDTVLPKPTSITVHQTGFGGKVPTPKSTGQRLAEQIRTAAKTIQTPKSPFKPTFTAISQTREEIVKEAIADVAELLEDDYIRFDYGVGDVVGAHVGSSVDFTFPGDRVDFFINKKKRVVVAKLYLEKATGTAKEQSYATTGIARCAPSDVFNEHVGKAIALRRALGLPVPTKYYEVGGIVPEGKQVGDVVRGPSYADNETHTKTLQKYWDFTRDAVGYQSVFARRAKVIDDSARYVAPSTPAAKVVYVD